MHGNILWGLPRCDVLLFQSIVPYTVLLIFKSWNSLKQIWIIDKEHSQYWSGISCYRMSYACTWPFNSTPKVQKPAIPSLNEEIKFHLNNVKEDNIDIFLFLYQFHKAELMRRVVHNHKWRLTGGFQQGSIPFFSRQSVYRIITLQVLLTKRILNSLSEGKQYSHLLKLNEIGFLSIQEWQTTCKPPWKEGDMS